MLGNICQKFCMFSASSGWYHLVHEGELKWGSQVISRPGGRFTDVWSATKLRIVLWVSVEAPAQQDVWSFLGVQLSCQSDRLPDRRVIVAESKVDVTSSTHTKKNQTNQTNKTNNKPKTKTNKQTTRKTTPLHNKTAMNQHYPIDSMPRILHALQIAAGFVKVNILLYFMWESNTSWETSQS